MELRDYQSEAINLSLENYHKGIKRQLICLPTGTGKTATFSGLIAKSLHFVKSAIVIVPRVELLYQSSKSFREIFPDIPCGIYHNKNTKFEKVTFSTFQTLASRFTKIQQANFGLCIFDEAHHATAPSCRRILKELGFMDDKYLVGFTATSQRSDGVGLNKVFKEIVYQKNIPQMVAKGYLCPIKGIQVQTGINIDAAINKHVASKTRGKFTLNEDEIDQEEKCFFKSKELCKIINCQERNELIVKTYIEHCKDRNKGIVFCQSIEHAEDLSKEFKNLDISSEYVHCHMTRKDIKNVLEKFKAGELKVICNARMLTEGFDEPSVDLVMLAKPTHSQLVYTQMIGRGTRIFPGKENCMVVDFDDKCSYNLMNFHSLDDRPKGESHFPERKNTEDSVEIEGGFKDVNIFSSDGVLHIQKIDFDNMKRNFKKNESWRKDPCTTRQIKLFAKINNLDKNIDQIAGRRVIDLNKGELSDFINASPATDNQKSLLVELGIDFDDGIIFGLACDIIDKHKHVSDCSMKILKKIYTDHLGKEIPENLSEREAKLLIDNAPLSEKQIQFLQKAGVNYSKLTFMSAQNLIENITHHRAVSMSRM